MTLYQVVWRSILLRHPLFHAPHSAVKRIIARPSLQRLVFANPFSGAPPQTGLNEKELHRLWKEVKNSQGRVYYQNLVTGERSWSKPEEAEILSLAEVEVQEKYKREDVHVDSEKWNGDSIMMRLINHFWTAVDMARKAYWIGITGGFIWIAYELFHYYKDL